MTTLTEKVGFASPISEKAFSKRRSAGVELIATVALAVSLVIAVTAVSIGMARAQASCADSAGAKHLGKGGVGKGGVGKGLGKGLGMASGVIRP